MIHGGARWRCNTRPFYVQVLGFSDITSSRIVLIVDPVSPLYAFQNISIEIGSVSKTSQHIRQFIKTDDKYNKERTTIDEVASFTTNISVDVFQMLELLSDSTSVPIPINCPDCEMKVNPFGIDVPDVDKICPDCQLTASTTFGIPSLEFYWSIDAGVQYTSETITIPEVCLNPCADANGGKNQCPICSPEVCVGGCTKVACGVNYCNECTSVPCGISMCSGWAGVQYPCGTQYCQVCAPVSCGVQYCNECTPVVCTPEVCTNPCDCPLPCTPSYTQTIQIPSGVGITNNQLWIAPAINFGNSISINIPEELTISGLEMNVTDKFPVDDLGTDIDVGGVIMELGLFCQFKVECDLEVDVSLSASASYDFQVGGKVGFNYDGSSYSAIYEDSDPAHLSTNTDFSHGGSMAGKVTVGLVPVLSFGVAADFSSFLQSELLESDSDYDLLVSTESLELVVSIFSLSI